jgi:tRNA (cytidine/uridine-2'-O-)-methyltransferase
MIEIALYQPDIAPNVGTIARLCACLGLPLTIIEPAGFSWNDSKLRRAGMDYLVHVDLKRAASWAAFQANTELEGKRLVLLTSKATVPFYEFAFSARDVLLLGSESAGVPDAVHQAVAARITIPMRPQFRSLNVAVACGMVAAEALRQTASFPVISAIADLPASDQSS